jgi:5-(carboxyamino)imidazole ribonucleotide synthase
VTVGILGGGQLGRMLALAGIPLGLDFAFLDPSADAPSAELGRHFVAPYDDADALDALAHAVDVITYEFENVPGAVAGRLQRAAPVFPPPAALAVSQDRLEEKRLFERLGIPTAAYEAVATAEEAAGAAERLGAPALLKTRRMGYDGKGQARVATPAEAAEAFAALGGRPCLLEALVPFEREVSAIAARASDGEVCFYPLCQNEHRDGILWRSVAPAEGERAAAAAFEAVRAVMEHLEYVGVLAVEFFDVGGGLLANEMAPRVHNSGHWTIEGAETSQFENHLRAVAGMPLGATDARGHSVMLNILGEAPDPAAVLAVPGAHLHLYGKGPRPGRKLGHVTVRADRREDLAEAERKLVFLAPDA